MSQWAGGQHPLLTALRYNPQRPALQAAAGRRMGASQQAAQMKMMADQQKAQNFQRMLQAMMQQLQARQEQQWRSGEAKKERAAAQTRAETQAAGRKEREGLATDARDYLETGTASSKLKKAAETLYPDDPKALDKVAYALGYKIEVPEGKAGAIKAEIFGKVESVKKQMEEGTTPDAVAGDVAAIGDALRRNAGDWTPDEVDALATGLQLYVPGVLGAFRAQYARGRQMMTGQPAAPTATAPSAAAPAAGPIGRMAEGTPLESIGHIPSTRPPRLDLGAPGAGLNTSMPFPADWRGIPSLSDALGRLRDMLYPPGQPWGRQAPTSQPIDPNAPAPMTEESWNQWFGPQGSYMNPSATTQPLMPTTQPVDPVQQMLDEILRNYPGPLRPRR